MPTALARPWPSGPVVVSMPRCGSCSGWPAVCEPSCRNALHVVDRQRIAGQVQQRVQQHRAVAVRDHEAVAVRPLRIAGIVAQVVAPQDFGDVGHAHRHAGMAGVGFLDGIHREGADGIGKLPAARCLHRKAIPFGVQGAGWKAAHFGPRTPVGQCTHPVRRPGTSVPGNETDRK